VSDKVPAWIKIVRRNPTEYEKKVIKRMATLGAGDIFELLRPRLAAEEVEVFIAIALNSHSKIISMTEVARGASSRSIVCPKEVLRPMIIAGAAAFAVVHNHPSGDPMASPADIAMTARLYRAGEIVGCTLVDHVIIGVNHYFSFFDEGLLNVSEGRQG
jgi:DNA repair protein RadC